MKAFAKWLEEGAKQYGMAIHAWVFMTNHIHLLVTPEYEDSIARSMQYVGRYYVRYFNYRLTRSGTLFEGRYKAHLVQDSEYFLKCCRYIELNPVRAGMVADPADYSWSSYAAHAFGRKIKLWQAHAEYERLGEVPGARQAVYRQLFAEDLGQEVLSDIREAVRTGFVLGNEQFRNQVEEITGAPQSLRKRGRKRAQ